MLNIAQHSWAAGNVFESLQALITANLSRLFPSKLLIIPWVFRALPGPKESSDVFLCGRGLPTLLISALGGLASSESSAFDSYSGGA